MPSKVTEPHEDLQDGLIALNTARAAQSSNNPSALLVPHWYISGVTGNDRNSGVVQNSPLASFAEIIRRWGTAGPTITQNTVVEWLDDDALFASESAPYIFQPVMPQGSGDGNLLNLYGRKIAIASGTLGAVTALDAATGTVLQADLGDLAAGSVGYFLENTTRNALCWVDSIASGTTVNLSQPCAPSVTTPPAWWPGGGFGIPAILNTFQVGDSFVLYRLPKVNFGGIMPKTIGRWAPAFDGILCMMGNLQIPGPPGDSSKSFLTNPSFRMTESRCDSFIESSNGASNGVLEQFFNCFLPASGAFSQQGIYAGCLGNNDDYITALSGCVMGGNLIVHGTHGVVVGAAAGGAECLSLIGGIFLYGILRPLNSFQLNSPNYGLGYISGVYTIGGTVPCPGAVRYHGLASDCFQGAPILQCAGASIALAIDPSTGAFHPGRSLTVAQLDTSIAGGGFGGIAFGNDLVPAFVSSSAL